MGYEKIEYYDEECTKSLSSNYKMEEDITGQEFMSLKE